MARSKSTASEARARDSHTGPTHSGQAPAGPGTDEMRAVFESNGAAIHAAMQASEAMFEGMAELNKEVMSFASDRLRQGMQTSESLMACRDPASALSVQFEHARNATQAYLDEATRLMNLAARMSDQCLRTMESQTREAVEKAAKPD